MSGKESTESLKILQGTELLDTLENKGVRAELNRVFLNPIGLDLNIAGDGSLFLQTTSNSFGVVKSRVDHFKRQAFRSYANTKHETRQRLLGFVIQTQDLYAAEKLTEGSSIANPPSTRLGLILSLMEQIFLLCRQRVMEKSITKDAAWWEKLDQNQLIGQMYDSIMKGNFIDLINYTMLNIMLDDFNKEIEKLTVAHSEQLEDTHDRTDEAEGKGGDPA